MNITNSFFSNPTVYAGLFGKNLPAPLSEPKKTVVDPELNLPPPPPPQDKEFWQRNFAGLFPLKFY